MFLNGQPVHIQNALGAADGRRLLEGCLTDILQVVREKFPNAPILVRTDGGFNSDKLINELLFDAPLLMTEPRSYLDRKGSVHRFIGEARSYRAPSWTDARNLYYRLEENLQYNKIDLR